MDNCGPNCTCNNGVTCNVAECSHNVDCCKCDVAKIEVTHECVGTNAVETPHFCKSYQKR